jgi:Tfp pilus assembly ATPase PilU
MLTFDQDLHAKVKEGTIDEKTAFAYAMNPQDFKLMLAGSLITREAAGEASLSFMHPEDEGATTPGAPLDS